jgi:Methyltransferase domain
MESARMHPIFKVSAKISPLFRRKRIKKFLDVFHPTAQTRILDVGGIPKFWQEVPINARITLLNLYELDEYDRSFMTPNQTSVVGDGTKLDFEDQSFDIVFSNSVIEHLGTAENQMAFAREARRVGRGYWVQTPAKEFPIEPHYFAPCVHWFPKNIQRRLLPKCSLWGLLRKPSDEVLDYVLAELRLLRRREFRTLFPDGHFWTERTIGLPKSYTAYKIPQARCKDTNEINTTANEVEALQRIDQ